MKGTRQNKKEKVFTFSYPKTEESKSCRETSVSLLTLRPQQPKAQLAANRWTGERLGSWQQPRSHLDHNALWLTFLKSEGSLWCWLIQTCCIQRDNAAWPESAEKDELIRGCFCAALWAVHGIVGVFCVLDNYVKCHTTDNKITVKLKYWTYRKRYLCIFIFLYFLDLCALYLYI